MSEINKIKVGAFGSPFSHDVASCFGNRPSRFEWEYNKTNDIEVYMDYNILGGMHSKCKNKFLWMCESRELFLAQYEYIKTNLDLFKNIYKKIFVHDNELIKLDNIFEYCSPGSNKSWVTAGKIYPKKKLISMICSGNNVTSGHKYRNNLMADFKNKNLPIDFYGRSHNPFQKKEEALADYCFSFVVENGKYSDYYTEKIMDCFALGTIPIYYGSPDIGNRFDLNGIIILDDMFDFNSLNVDLYYSKLNYVKNNFDLERQTVIADDELFIKVEKYI